MCQVVDEADLLVHSIATKPWTRCTIGKSTTEYGSQTHRTYRTACPPHVALSWFLVGYRPLDGRAHAFHYYLYGLQALHSYIFVLFGAIVATKKDLAICPFTYAAQILYLAIFKHQRGFFRLCLLVRSTCP